MSEALERMMQKKKKRGVVFQPMEGLKPPYEPHFLGEACRFCVHEKDCQVQCANY